MKYQEFFHIIQQKLQHFADLKDKKITITENLFSKNTQTISRFIIEIEHTALLLSQQTSKEYADVYASKLFKQFEALDKAIRSLKQIEFVAKKHFLSSFSFPKNIHSLPENRRLTEYRKALRALNDKISWLIECSYEANEVERLYLQQQILETEYRKSKCLEAIEGLEEKLSFIK
ncbi:primosomal replication protein PriC [Actinobacillus arthritidis]|uniref:primosomal replication protein PriC n=1 Tax=Actinobacillus arthritidis TaxID=157339 RepID=UPI0024419BC6|nr:primosomal replication protein PriC [Actinobacillus arthritidis]WGE89955.1 primosomal replication protein [Actinobacillus arthritidis]